MKKIDFTNYFIVNGNCRVVNGAKRCLFINFFTLASDLMPNYIYDLIINSERIKTIEEILTDYSAHDKKIVMEYLEYLLSKKYITLVTKSDLQLYNNRIDEFNVPYHLTNGIIAIGKSTKIEQIISFFSGYTVPNIVIYVNYQISINDLAKIAFSFHESSVLSIEIHLRNDLNLEVEKLIKLFDIELRLYKIILYESESYGVIFQNNKLANYIIQVEEKLDNKNCGIVHPNYFSNHKLLFSESQSHNTCLNKKISIDEFGNIRNCPSMEITHGNIKDTTIEKILLRKGFNKYWEIKKDDIAVCKDCEFRRICTDCRAFTENPDDIYSKPLKCGYSPYTNKWEDWSTNPLKQKAIEHYGMQDFVVKR